MIKYCIHFTQRNYQSQFCYSTISTEYIATITIQNPYKYTLQNIEHIVTIKYYVQSIHIIQTPLIVSIVLTLQYKVLCIR